MIEMSYLIENIIVDDHNHLRMCLRQYNAFIDSDWQEAKKWYHQFLWEVSRHSVCEELILYPNEEKKLGPDGVNFATRSRDHHQKLKELRS